MAKAKGTSRLASFLNLIPEDEDPTLQAEKMIETAVAEQLTPSATLVKENQMNQTTSVQKVNTLVGAHIAAAAQAVAPFNYANLKATYHWETFDKVNHVWKDRTLPTEPINAIRLDPGMGNTNIIPINDILAVQSVISAFAAVAGQQRYSVISAGLSLYKKPENPMGSGVIGVITPNYDGTPFAYNGKVYSKFEAPVEGTVRTLVTNFGMVSLGRVYSIDAANDPELDMWKRKEHRNYIFKHLAIDEMFVAGVQYRLILGPRTVAYANKVIEGMSGTPDENVAHYTQKVNDIRTGRSILRNVSQMSEDAVAQAPAASSTFVEVGTKNVVDIRTLPAGTWVSVYRDVTGVSRLCRIMVGGPLVEKMLIDLEHRVGRADFAASWSH